MFAVSIQYGDGFCANGCAILKADQTPTAVSYTHLDVYKRQVLHTFPYEQMKLYVYKITHTFQKYQTLYSSVEIEG